MDLAQLLPCDTCRTKACERFQSCKEVDKLVGSGKTWQKKKTYAMDMERTLLGKDALNWFQVEVHQTVMNSRINTKEELAIELSLRDAFDALDSREKEIVILHYLEGRTQTEIAQKLNVSQPRVRQILDKALEKMRPFVSRDMIAFFVDRTQTRLSVKPIL